MTKRFIILASVRTGSNWLVSSLNASTTPSVLTCYPELFIPKRDMADEFMTSPSFTSLRQPVPYWCNSGLTAMQYCQGIVWNNGTKCIGAKVMIEHPTAPQVLQAALALGARIIYLSRQDIAAQAISREVAASLNLWWGKPRRAVPKEITLNVSNVVKWVRQHRAQSRWVESQLPKGSLKLTYEHLATKIPSALDWLSVPYRLNVKPPGVEKNPPMRVVNRKEIEEAVRRAL